jgi:RNA polymerase-interacting CarD/CdnL/TRCF family regulator
LQQADTAAGVLELLEQARAFTADAEDNLAAQLDEILAEARDTPGLEERIPEAEAYVETIKAEQGAAFSDAGAGAELAASGAEARVAIASIKSRLQRDLAEAKTAEEVDSILNEAESDAMALTNRMNGNIDDVISTHNLASPEGAKKSDAEVLAGDLRKAVAKDIDNIRGKAIAFADERKAGLEKDAANAAQALFEATAARAAAAGASMAKLQAQLKYYQGQAMSAATDADKAAADLQVVSLEAQIAQLTEDQAAAQKEAARLEEANKNSQALSRLADEIAAAKSTSDGVINGLLDKQDEIHAKIDARNEAFEQMYE